MIVVCEPDTLRSTFGPHWSLYWMITPLGFSGGLHEITADADVVKVTLSFLGVLGSVNNLSLLLLLQQTFLTVFRGSNIQHCCWSISHYCCCPH